LIIPLLTNFIKLEELLYSKFTNHLSKEVEVYSNKLHSNLVIQILILIFKLFSKIKTQNLANSTLSILNNSIIKHK